jgi:hypothetical protein
MITTAVYVTSTITAVLYVAAAFTIFTISATVSIAFAATTVFTATATTSVSSASTSNRSPHSV